MTNCPQGDIRQDANLETNRHHGLFIPAMKLLAAFFNYTSVNWHLRRVIRDKWGITVEANVKKTPPWVSELYVLGALSFGVVGVYLAQPTISPMSPLGLLCIIWPIYRMYELSGFLVDWVFVSEVPLHSASRSLIGFLLNLLEIGMLLTTLSVVCMKVVAPERWGAMFELSIAILALEAPILHERFAWAAIEVIRFLFGIVLGLCVISSLAGGIVRRSIQER